MTYLRNFSRFVVVLLTLAGISAAAIPAGWIALRYDPPSGEEQKGHWIIVKAPEDGLAAWWSDAELARIVANDPDYVKHLETGWNPEDHPVADSDEAERLTAELARYWGGDVPQANFWAHGALTRRGSTLRAFRWEQDGPAQRSELEQDGLRPSIPAAALDPDPVDQRYDNRADVVTYGDRWGDHLQSGTLDYVYTAERNKAQRRHHPNPPPAGEVAEKARETVEACRAASLEAEMGVFENYVRAWGGLSPKSVSFGLPANCVADPGPLALLAPPPPPPPARPPSPPPSRPVTPPQPPQRPVTPPQPPQRPVTPPQPPQRPVTPPQPPQRPVTPPTPPSNPPSTCPPGLELFCGGDPDPVTTDPDPDPDPEPVTTNPNPGGGTNPGNPVIEPPPPPPPPPPTDKYYDCKGDQHDTQAEADAVSCNPTYTACDGSIHSTQAAANAVDCSQQFQDQILHDLTCEGTVDQTTGQCDDLTYTP